MENPLYNQKVPTINNPSIKSVEDTLMINKMKEKKKNLAKNEKDFTQVLPRDLTSLIFKYFIISPKPPSKYKKSKNPPPPPPPSFFQKCSNEEVEKRYKDSSSYLAKGIILLQIFFFFVIFFF